MSINFIVRKYNDGDCGVVSRLFFDTVHTVNAADYTNDQLFAWAHDTAQLQQRRGDLLRQNTLVAEFGGKIAGFASMDRHGCLDLLFVSKDFQRHGVATALCDELEKDFDVIKTYSSVTAKPFFEKRGYTVIKEQTVERLGIKLKNFEMQKIKSIIP